MFHEVNIRYLGYDYRFAPGCCPLLFRCCLQDLFTITTPTFFTWPVIATITVSIALFLAIAGAVAYWAFKRHLGKKLREYVGQVISANPEYLSQLDVYKADEWELKRNELQLEEEIGRGTFGKVG